MSTEEQGTPTPPRPNFTQLAGWMLALLVFAVQLVVLVNDLTRSDEQESGYVAFLLYGAIGGVVLFGFYFFYRKTIRVITPPISDERIPVAPAHLEKLTSQLTDLQVAFRVMLASGSILIAGLSFLGYTTIRDVASQGRVQDMKSRIKAVGDSVDISLQKQGEIEQQQNTIKTRYESLMKTLQTSEEDIRTLTASWQKEALKREEDLKNAYSGQLQEVEKSTQRIAQLKQQAKNDFDDFAKKSREIKASVENSLSSSSIPIMNTDGPLPLSVRQRLSAVILMNGVEQPCQISFIQPDSVVLPLRIPIDTITVVTKLVRKDNITVK